MRDVLLMGVTSCLDAEALLALPSFSSLVYSPGLDMCVEGIPSWTRCVNGVLYWTRCVEEVLFWTRWVVGVLYWTRCVDGCVMSLQVPDNPPNYILFLSNLPEETNEMMLSMLFNQ